MVASRVVFSPLLLAIVAAGLLLLQSAAQPGQEGLVRDIGMGIRTIDLPLSFEANHGQTDDSVSFVSHNGGFDVFATDSGPALSLGSGSGVTRVDINLVGANPAPAIRGGEQLPGTVNYIMGRDSSRWLTNIPTYSGVVYERVYPGIDLVVYGNQGGALEYDFIVAPGADPSQVKVAFDGADGVKLQSDGSLLLTLANGEIVQHPPVVYQESGGVRVPVEGHYVLDGDLASFEVGEYDLSLPLVIDPIIVWASFLGGLKVDDARAVATDDENNVYVTGTTTSADFPATPGAFSETYTDTALSDVFVTKINEDGTNILYSTYIGGTGIDVSADIEVNGDGEAFVVGLAGDGFPGTAGSGGFALKLSDDGSALEYSTTMGVNTELFGLEIDGDGKAYFAGSSLQGAFAATAGSFQPALNGNGDGIVGVLSEDGSTLEWGSYIGGTDREFAYDVARDGDGYVYVTGITPSEDFPTVNADDATLAALRDAFVAKIMPDGSALMYSTYLGGDGGGLSDQGYGITADNDGNAYVTGYTNSSTTFPTTNGSFQQEYGGNTDAFVTKYDADGDMVYSTFLGGNNVDHGAGIEVDADGNVLVGGQTASVDFPTASPIQTDQFSTDAFVALLNASGSALLFSTYIGGAGEDTVDVDGSAVSLAEDGTIYFVGQTSSADFPTTNGAFQAGSGGGIGVQGGLAGEDDAFIIVIGEGSGLPWGDSDCDGTITTRDNQALLRTVLNVNALSQTEPCPDLGTEVTADGNAQTWGDWDCDGVVGTRDNQALLRSVLNVVALSQTQPCPTLGILTGLQTN